MKGSGIGMLSQSAKQSLEEATAKYQANVDMAGPYLASRGITREVAAITRLGYVAPDDHMIDHTQYVGRLAIPYITPVGGVVELRFRALLDDGSPKYLSRAGAEPHLYNVNAFTADTDVIAICEGEIDTITAHYLCGIPAVGLAGANGWKNWYSRAFMDYRVLVLCDGDEPGRDLGKRIAQQMDNAIVVSMPDGQDVNSVYLSEGSDGVRKRVGM